MSTGSHNVTQNVLLRNGLRPGAPYTPYLDDPWADPPISFPLYGKPATYIEQKPQKPERPSGRTAAAAAASPGAAGPSASQGTQSSSSVTTSDAFVTSRGSSRPLPLHLQETAKIQGLRPSADSYYPKSAWGRTPRPNDPPDPEKADGPMIEGVNTGDLNSLYEPPTSQEKPPYPYTTILRFAILGSPRKKLTLGEIYETMENRFPWFKNNTEKGWKNSVRHTLSLGRCFVKVNRPVTEPGKGAYWSFDPSQGEGKVRSRNRAKKGKKSATEQNEEDEQMDIEEEEEPEATSVATPTASADASASAGPSTLQHTPPGVATSPISAPMSGHFTTESVDSEANLIARGLDDLVEIRKAAAAKKKATDPVEAPATQPGVTNSPPSNVSSSTTFARSPALASASASTSATIPISHFARLGGAAAYQQHGVNGAVYVSGAGLGTPNEGGARQSPAPSDTAMSDGPGRAKSTSVTRQPRYTPYEYPGPPPAGGV